MKLSVFCFSLLIILFTINFRQELLSGIYLKVVIFFLLYTLVLLWGKLLRLFHNNLKVLKVGLFNMVSFYRHVTK